MLETLIWLCWYQYLQLPYPTHVDTSAKVATICISTTFSAYSKVIATYFNVACIKPSLCENSCDFEMSSFLQARRFKIKLFAGSDLFKLNLLTKAILINQNF